MKKSAAVHDLTTWRRDGQGGVSDLGAGAFGVEVVSPITLWCPQPLEEGGCEIAFDCCLNTAGSAMLLILCARAWRGNSAFLEHPRSGAYADYAYGDLEMYTVGFNRAQHVSNDVQPNASTVNVRRIGGSTGVAFAQLDLADRSPEMMQRWQAWDDATRLGSALEPAAGVGRYHRYRFRKFDAQILIDVNGTPLLTASDPHPRPLDGGHWAIRNMTPGASFRVRSIRAQRI